MEKFKLDKESPKFLASRLHFICFWTWLFFHIRLIYFANVHYGEYTVYSSQYTVFPLITLSLESFLSL